MNASFVYIFVDFSLNFIEYETERQIWNFEHALLWQGIARKSNYWARTYDDEMLCYIKPRLRDECWNCASSKGKVYDAYKTLTDKFSFIYKHNFTSAALTIQIVSVWNKRMFKQLMQTIHKKQSFM